MSGERVGFSWHVGALDRNLPRLLESEDELSGGPTIFRWACLLERLDDEILDYTSAQLRGL